MYRGSVAVLVLAVSLATAACSSSGARPSPVALDCQGGVPSDRPSELVLACGDGTVRATSLSWSVWGAAGANGVGDLSVVACDPDCARGTPVRRQSHFALHDPTTVDGRNYFRTLVVSVDSGGPQVRCALSTPAAEGGCASELVDAGL